MEHNAWGPAGTRIIMRPTGAREYVVHDHLGSARLTYDNTGGVVERRSYRAFGVETQSDGEGARTSYIGREKDNESDLGIGACPVTLRRRVRMYEPDYGRFLSVDPLWGLYSSVQPYHYSLNQPLSQIDDGGKWVEAKTPEAQEAVRNSVPSRHREAVVFHSDGILQIEPLKKAAEGQDVNSNIAILSRLAENESTIEVAVADEVTALKKSGNRISAQFSEIDQPGERILGLTLVRRSDQKTSGLSDGVPFSTSGNIQVVIRKSGESKQSQGVTAAHELFAHVRFVLLCRAGKAASARERDPEVQKAIKRAEREAQSP